MSEQDLKPCPLCGNDAPHFDGEWVWCSEESTACALSRWPSDPIQWNRRPAESRLAARVSELETENAKLWRCVELADIIVETSPNTALFRLNDYDAARAEVDK